MGLWKNHIAKYDGCVSPTAQVIIGNKKWESAGVSITRVQIATSTGCEAGTCSVELTLPETESKDKKIKLNSDFSQIKVGVELEIHLGYNVNKKAELSKAFIGYISAYEVEIKSNGSAVVTIEGMDAKMWMMASCRTELKKNIKKYSGAVSDIYKDYIGKFKGKTINIKEEAKFETPIYQRNESDYEFLCRVASITGALFFVNLGKLCFISPTAFKSPKLTISPCVGIYNVRVSMSVWGVPKAIEAISIDSKNFCKSINSRVTDSNTLGSGKSAAKLTHNIGQANTVKIIDNTLSSVGEAKFIAQAEYNKREFNLVEGYLEVAGNPDIDLGCGLKIQDMGDPLDNNYIVTGLEHELVNNKYVTRIKINTNRFSPQKPSLF